MDDWNEMTVEGSTMWVSDTHGTIMKTPNGQYVAMVPKVIRVGPFTDLDPAKSACEDTTKLNQVLDEYNLEVIRKA